MVSTIILTRNVKTISFHYIPPINKYKTKVIINSWEHKLLPALDSCKNYTICHVPRMLIYERRKSSCLFLLLFSFIMYRLGWNRGQGGTLEDEVAQILLRTVLWQWWWWRHCKYSYKLQVPITQRFEISLRPGHELDNSSVHRCRKFSCMSSMINQLQSQPRDPDLRT